MTYRGDVVGYLKFDALRAQKTWSDHTIALLKTVGEIFVNALEHKRAQEALQFANLTLEARVKARTQEIERRQRVAEGLRDILVVLNSDRPIGEILDYLVAQACALLDSSACVLYRVNQERASCRSQLGLRKRLSHQACAARLQYLVSGERVGSLLTGALAITGPEHSKPDSIDSITTAGKEGTCKWRQGTLDIRALSRLW